MNLVLNLWTDLFSPFFVLAQKHVLASQSIRFNDLLQNKSSICLLYTSDAADELDGVD
ncbi:hypothetical protein I5C72_14725, partial [Staphylococcus aureus]|nr:hypothetical protein [Staphylococcus aureus]